MTDNSTDHVEVIRRGLNIATTMSGDVPITPCARRDLNDAYAALDKVSRLAALSGAGGGLLQQIARDVAEFAALPAEEQATLKRELATIGHNPGIVFATHPGDHPGEAGERFLTAHVSRDGKIVGIDHPGPGAADWHDVRVAHVALRDRINKRLATEDRCPFKPTSAPAGDGARREAIASNIRRQLAGDYDRVILDRAEWDVLLSVLSAQAPSEAGR